MPLVLMVPPSLVSAFVAVRRSVPVPLDVIVPPALLIVAAVRVKLLPLVPILPATPFALALLSRVPVTPKPVALGSSTTMVPPALLSAVTLASVRLPADIRPPPLLTSAAPVSVTCPPEISPPFETSMLPPDASDVVKLTVLPPIWPPCAVTLPEVAVALSVLPAINCPRDEAFWPPTSIEAAATVTLPVAAITPVFELSAPGVVSSKSAVGAVLPEVKTPASNCPEALLSMLAATSVRPPWPLMVPPAFIRLPVVIEVRPPLASVPLLASEAVGLNVAVVADVIDPELTRLAPDAVRAPED